MVSNDIIAAVATAPGRSGIGIVRVSGPALEPLMTGILGRAIPPRRAVLADFRDAHGTPIDTGIALFFPKPYSYTGEDVLELQGHGGPVVLRLLLERCLELGARVAEPGEFTRRAFLNDKLDLAQAESVVDLIDAATAQAARGALRSLQGEFSRLVQELVSDLVDLRTLVEATLDFPEEEIDFLKQADAEERLTKLKAKIQEVLTSSRQGCLLREGLYVVIAGQPNVGKSSILNRLAGEDVAIVTEIPGTTRDAIRQTVNVEGIPVHVIDTAGLRDSQDPVERIGITRTWSEVEKADLILIVMDASQGETAADRSILARLPPEVSWLRVYNKIDLIPKAPGVEESQDGRSVWVSAKTGAGFDLLRQALLEAGGWRAMGGEAQFLARARHVEALERAAYHLQRAATTGSDLELMAEELRLSQEALGAITGEFTADDLLGEIFSRFCIGK
jgi:tRNA modification GTPase